MRNSKTILPTKNGAEKQNNGSSTRVVKALALTGMG